MTEAILPEVLPAKMCTKCGRVQTLDRFTKQRSNPDGMTYQCKDCAAAYAVAWRESHREYCREKSRERLAKMSPEELERKRVMDNARYRRDPDAYRDKTLKRLFGISVDEYDEMLAAQGGRCAICKATEGDSSGRKLAVDHHHGSGKVRGLLCSGCNNGLGRFKDDPELLARAITYLLETT